MTQWVHRYSYYSFASKAFTVVTVVVTVIANQQIQLCYK